MSRAKTIAVELLRRAKISLAREKVHPVNYPAGIFKDSL